MCYVELCVCLYACMYVLNDPSSFWALIHKTDRSLKKTLFHFCFCSFSKDFMKNKCFQLFLKNLKISMFFTFPSFCFIFCFFSPLLKIFFSSLYFSLNSFLSLFFVSHLFFFFLLFFFSFFFLIVFSFFLKNLLFFPLPSNRLPLLFILIT